MQAKFSKEKIMKECDVAANVARKEADEVRKLF